MSNIPLSATRMYLGLVRELCQFADQFVTAVEADPGLVEALNVAGLQDELQRFVSMNDFTSGVTLDYESSLPTEIPSIHKETDNVVQQRFGPGGSGRGRPGVLRSDVPGSLTDHVPRGFHLRSADLTDVDPRSDW